MTVYIISMIVMSAKTYSCILITIYQVLLFMPHMYYDEVLKCPYDIGTIIAPIS